MATVSAKRVSPSDEQVIKWYDELSNWGRWGKDDYLGTLNLITPDKKLQAASLVKEGINVSCSYPIRFNEHNLDDGHPEPRHYMTGTPNPNLATVGNSGTGDIVVLNCHGLTLTHLDSPCHYMFKPALDRPLTGFNGLLPTAVNQRDGATKGSVTLAGSGIVSRGVLLDIARAKGVDWLEPGTPIFPEDLEEAEAKQGVKVGPGDVLCIRTGHGSRKRKEGWNSRPGEQAGPDGAMLPWMKQRDIAVLACDTANDWIPKREGMMARPIHCVAIPSMGMWLIDGGDYEELGEQCARLNRWEYMFVIPPLKLTGGSASPVNPIAIM